MLATGSDLGTWRTPVPFVVVRSVCGAFLWVSVGGFNLCVPVPLALAGRRGLGQSKLSAPHRLFVGEPVDLVFEEVIVLLGEFIVFDRAVLGVRLFVRGLRWCPVFVEIEDSCLRRLLEDIEMEVDFTRFLEELVEDSRWVWVALVLSLGWAGDDAISFQM